MSDSVARPRSRLAPLRQRDHRRLHGAGRARERVGPGRVLPGHHQQPAGCVGTTCEIQAAFSSSIDNGQTWTAPEMVSDPMQLAWLAPTNQGVMVGDYVSTSFLAGQQRVIGVFAWGFPNPAPGSFDEPMFAALEKVRRGTNAGAQDRVRAGGEDEETATRAF